MGLTGGLSILLPLKGLLSHVRDVVVLATIMLHDFHHAALLG
jgi:hypothetical protein